MAPAVIPIFKKYLSLYNLLPQSAEEDSIMFLDSVHTELRKIVAEASRSLSFRDLLQFKEACELIEG